MQGNDTTKALIGKTTVLIPGDETGAGRSIDVAELRWPDAMQFFRMLSEHVGNLVTMDGAGRPVFDFQKLREAIPASGALAEFLVSRSTGLKPEEIAALTTSQFLEVLAVTMELNLSEEIVGKFKRLSAVISRTLGGPRSNSPTPSTS